MIEKPNKIKYLSDGFIQKYHPFGFIHYIQIANNNLTEAYQYAEKHDSQYLERIG